MDEEQTTAWHTRSVRLERPVDAEALFAGLYAGAADSFWLDSAREAHGTGRWSLMGCLEGPLDARVTWSARTGRLTTSGPGGTTVLRDADPWTWLADRLAEHPVPPSAAGIPFLGGFVGYLGHGVPGPERPPRPDEEDLDVEMLHVTRFLAIDHVEGVVHAVVTGPADDAGEQDAWLERTRERARSARPVPPAPSPPDGGGVARASVDRTDHLAGVARVGEWLRAGETYEACYTYRLALRSAEDPFGTYRRLRRSNPAPYAAFLRSRRRAVLSCSPERYLHVDGDGRAETRPIKGTARRVAGADDDARAADHLAADPKSRAENLIIVDLLRNDLSRACVPGTVSVPSLMAVETYATVHQMVSTVRGDLLPGTGAVAAARALFPPGSMTGAPKARTVELLDALEVRARGVYSGVLGCFSRCGRADLSVVIRTAVHDGDRVSVGTGGAVVLDSDAGAEREETALKAAAVLRAYGYVHPDDVDAAARG